MLKKLRFVVVAMLMGGGVFAQSPPRARGEGRGALPDSVDGAAPHGAALSGPEMLEQSQKYLDAMRNALKRIQSLAVKARKDRDVIKLNCITDKLVRTKVNLNIAEQAAGNLQEAISRTDEGARLHEFARLSIVHQKVTVIDSEAQHCIGEDLTFVGATQVGTEVSPTIPSGDPTAPPLPAPDLERPPAATPYL